MPGLDPAPPCSAGQVLSGPGRAKLGMFEGDLDEGELEVSQGIGLIQAIKSCQEVVQDILLEYHAALDKPFWRDKPAF